MSTCHIYCLTGGKFGNLNLCLKTLRENRRREGRPLLKGVNEIKFTLPS
jgi:hypothetical protein